MKIQVWIAKSAKNEARRSPEMELKTKQIEIVTNW